MSFAASDIGFMDAKTETGFALLLVPCAAGCFTALGTSLDLLVVLSPAGAVEMFAHPPEDINAASPPSADGRSEYKSIAE